MSEHDDQLKLQAYLDGELPDPEAREVANWLARDREAVALLAELRHTRKALKGFESGIKLPETREFYWSKIEREIVRLELTQPAASRPAPAIPWWRKFLVPAGAFAALLLLAGVAARQFSLPFGSALFSRSTGQQFCQVETALADTSAFTYRDQSAGITVVWLSYPGENVIADRSPADTIQ